MRGRLVDITRRVVVVNVVPTAAAVAGRLLQARAVRHAVLRGAVLGLGICLIADVRASTAAAAALRLVTPRDHQVQVEAAPRQARERVLVGVDVRERKRAIAVAGVLSIPRLTLRLFLVFPGLLACVIWLDLLTHVATKHGRLTELALRDAVLNAPSLLRVRHLCPVHILGAGLG